MLLFGMVIIKHCAQCGQRFNASCGSEKFCTNDCMFLASFEVSGDCWIWTRQKDKDGYGIMRLKGRGRIKAHRFSFERKNGPLPVDTMACHSCDDTACVNDAHLFAGTALDNKRDCMVKGRHLRGTAHHKAVLTEADVLAILASKKSGASLARQYGVTKENIYAVRNRKTWKEL